MLGLLVSKRKYHLASDDYYRVLLSDLQPYHMPLIFSNKGFYEAVKSNNRFNEVNKSLVSEDLRKFEVRHATVPFFYYISKNSNSLRELSLIHPYQQLNFVDFYKNYYSLILYYCSKSKFSLRYPSKKNSTVYTLRRGKVYEKLIKQFKSDHPDLASEDKEFKYASTFFAYKKYDFNYKFYESNEFIKLERRYSNLKMIDVSRCFDSLYTHSISWAIRGKDYIKVNKGGSNQSFDEYFDKLMQNANHQETNGILIGSEVARIFAEIILQDIDQKVLDSLNSKGIFNNSDYTIRRYVDDFCIFAKSKEIADKVTDVVADELNSYKLYINTNKTKYFSRPFITNRSRNITELRRLVKNKMGDTLEKVNIYNKDNSLKDYYYFPNKTLMYNPTRSSTYFIKDLKSYWHVEGEYETGFSNYLLRALNEQLLMFVNKFNIIHTEPEEISLDTIINYLIFIFDLALYAFSLEPKVNLSFTFSRLVLVMTRLSKVELKDYHEKLAHRIHTGLTDLLENELSRDCTCMVERLNILLLLNDIGEYYLPNEQDLKKYLFNESYENLNYFSLITGLFIVKRKSKYKNILNFIIENIKFRLESLPNPKKSSEAMHLYMDSMSCPYIDKHDKESITNIVIHSVSQNRRTQTIKDHVEFFSKYYWFVDWQEVDILNKLFRKQLRRAY